MLRLAALLCLTSMTHIPATTVSQSANKPSVSIESAEVQSLKNDSSRFQAEIERLREKEDKWNARNREFAIAAVILGGLLGLASWGAQREASAIGLSSRPIADQKDKAEARIRELLDQQYDLDISKANGLAARANAKSEREKLEALVSPRRLTLDQQKEIGNACLGMTGKPIVIQSYGLDGEGGALAAQIINALGRLGLNVEPKIGNLITTGESDSGINVRGPEEDTEFLKCVANALRTIGNLDVEVNGPTHIPSAALMGGAIGVGPAPKPGQMAPGGPTPPGSPILIMVGIKPVKLLGLK